MMTQVPDGFLNQFATGSEKQFLSPEGGNIALLAGDDPLFQPFTGDGTKFTGSDTKGGIDLASFQLNPDPPAFNNQFPQIGQIEFLGEGENQEPVASNPGFSEFLSS